jgi:DNA-binding response OmpR family regulator
VKSARVLVVDDEPVIVEVLIRYLDQHGQRAKGAESAEEAESALAAAPYDLVLLDHVLPGVTGMQALGKLRALTKAPIYIMSGYTGDDTRADVMLLGATGFLPKPIDLNELLALIAALPESS